MFNPIKEIKLLFNLYISYRELSVRFNDLVDNYASLSRKINDRENELHRKETGFIANIKSMHKEISDLKKQKFVLKKQVDFLTEIIEKGEISQAFLAGVKAEGWYTRYDGIKPSADELLKNYLCSLLQKDKAN